VTGTYFLDSSSIASAHTAAVYSSHSNGHVTIKNSSVSDGPSGSSSYCARNSQTSDTSSSALSMGSDVTTLSSVTDYYADDENTTGLTDSILAAVAADSDNEDGFMESLSSVSCLIYSDWFMLVVYKVSDSEFMAITGETVG
jgi:hypothetical protein